MTLQMYIDTVTNVMSVLIKMMSWGRDGESLMNCFRSILDVNEYDSVETVVNIYRYLF